MTQSKERVMGEEGLYRSSFEHDNCGIGAVVNIKGEKSHATVENALKIVENLEHRAGKDAEGKTGDGVGILLQLSHKFFSKACSTLGFSLGGEREYGVGVFFFPHNELNRNQAKKMFEIIVEKEGMEFLGWREVPTYPSVLGHKNLLRGKTAPCFPGFEKDLYGAVATGAPVERDGNIITARGMGVALEFGLKTVEALCGSEVAESIKTSVQSE